MISQLHQAVTSEAKSLSEHSSTSANRDGVAALRGVMDGIKVSASAFSAPKAADNSTVALEKMTMIYRGAPIAALGSAINAMIVMVVGWAMVNRSVLMGWAGVVCVIAAIRFGFWISVRRQRPTISVMSRFNIRNLVCLIINGALWGMLAPIFAVYGQIGHVFLPFILAGMTAASIVSSGANWKCVLAFNIPALLPMAAAFFFWGGEGSAMIAGVIILYGILTSIVALQTSRMIDRAIWLRSKNASLSEALVAKFDDASESEKRFKALVESSRELTLIFSPDGRISYASPASEEILGIKPQHLVGTTTRDLMHHDDLPQFKAAGSSALSVIGDVQTLSHVCLKNKDHEFVALTGRLINMLYVPGVEGFVFTGSILDPGSASRLHAAQ